MAAYKNFLFQVMAMDDNRIARLKMTILPVDVNEGDERSKERDKDRDR